MSRDNEKIANSLASMVTEYVDGGIRGGTDWRNGLDVVILKRLQRFSLAAPMEDTVEDLAKWLHAEVEWPEYDFPSHSWPDHPEDDGKRGDGWLKIIPRSSADEFRAIAQRTLSCLSDRDDLYSTMRDGRA